MIAIAIFFAIIADLFKYNAGDGKGFLD